MLIFLKTSSYIAILYIVLLLTSCAVNNKNNVLYYSIPTVSYLRECPSYDCPVVTEIYNADKIEVLGKTDTGWWHVQSLRDEKTGWTQSDLLSDNPIIPKIYYVAVGELPLRNSPNEDVVSRKLLNYGDEIQKLTEQDNWWRVLAQKDKVIGWVPARMVSEKPPEPPGEPPKTAKTASEPLPLPKNVYYFVGSENVNLHLLPSSSSQVLKVLRLNDTVEKISQSGTTWIKVRFLGTGAEGWAYARSFKDSPVTNKDQISANKKKILKKTSSRQNKKSPESEAVEPEGM